MKSFEKFPVVCVCVCVCVCEIQCDSRAIVVAQLAKNLPGMQATLVQFLSLEKG